MYPSHFQPLPPPTLQTGIPTTPMLPSIMANQIGPPVQPMGLQQSPMLGGSAIYSSPMLGSGYPNHLMLQPGMSSPLYNTMIGSSASMMSPTMPMMSSSMGLSPPVNPTMSSSMGLPPPVNPMMSSSMGLPPPVNPMMSSGMGLPPPMMASPIAPGLPVNPVSPVTPGVFRSSPIISPAAGVTALPASPVTGPLPPVRRVLYQTLPVHNQPLDCDMLTSSNSSTSLHSLSSSGLLPQAQQQPVTQTIYIIPTSSRQDLLQSTSETIQQSPTQQSTVMIQQPPTQQRTVVQQPPTQQSKVTVQQPPTQQSKVTVQQPPTQQNTTVQQPPTQQSTVTVQQTTQQTESVYVLKASETSLEGEEVYLTQSETGELVPAKSPHEGSKYIIIKSNSN